MMDEKIHDAELVTEANLVDKIKQFYALFSELEALGDEDSNKAALVKKAQALIDAINEVVIRNPILLKTAWEAMAEQGYGGDAYNLAQLALRDGRGMGEQELLEHVKAVAREMIEKNPEGWALEENIRELTAVFLNERSNEKLKIADKVASPEVFETIDDIKAGIKRLLEEDGVVETEKFEDRILRIYENQKLGNHWRKAKEIGKEKEFLEKFPTGVRTELWQSFYLSYVHILLRKNIESREDLSNKWEINTQEAFETFAPEVLLAMAAGREGQHLNGKTGRDKLGSPDNWNANEKAEIVRRVMESDAIKDGLALLDVMDLPLPEAEKFKSDFYNAYLRRDPKKITANAEFFEDLVRGNGKPAEALEFLNSRKVLKLETLEAIKVPGEDEVESMNLETVLKIVMENHNLLLEKMKKLGPKNIPFYGLSGGDRPQEFMRRAEANERVYLQFVATLENLDDPNLALVDLYDVVGGDKSYFASKGHGFFVMELEDEYSEQLKDYWGDRGEFKNWQLGGHFVAKPMDTAREAGIALGAEQIQFLRFFQNTKEKERRPHADKTAREFAAGTSREEVSKRLIAQVKAADTPLYLLKQDWHLRIDDSATPGKVKRNLFREIIYVQAVSSKIIDAFIERKAKKAA